MKRSQLQVFDDLVSLSRAAAELVAALAREPRPDGRPFSLALCGGGTPQRLYRLLGQPPYRLTIPWGNVHIFWSDERCVPQDDPESNYGQARELWLQHVPLPPHQVHRIKGELGATDAAQAYVAELGAFAQATLTEAAWPRFDLVLLGLGEDGHVASLFPGAPDPAESQQAALAVRADYQGRPAERVTLTPVILSAAQHVVFLVAGEAKAPALAASLGGQPDPARWPAQRIRPETGHLIWMADRAAARLVEPQYWS
jgi:6-phosphogluconolactonase